MGRRAYVQSSHDKDDMRKFGICPYKFITPAIQWLVSCYDRVLLAHLVSDITKRLITVVSVSLSSAGAWRVGSIHAGVTGG